MSEETCDRCGAEGFNVKGRKVCKQCLDRDNTNYGSAKSKIEDPKAYEAWMDHAKEDSEK